MISILKLKQRESKSQFLNKGLRNFSKSKTRIIPKSEQTNERSMTPELSKIKSEKNELSESESKKNQNISKKNLCDDFLLFFFSQLQQELQILRMSSMRSKLIRRGYSQFCQFSKIGIRVKK